VTRRFGRWLALGLALLGTALPACAAGQKVLRFAIEIAETGFDPAQISDLYSRDIASNIFDAPLRYAFLAPAGTIEPNTVASMPEASADFRTFTFTVKPGIYFADDQAFGGKRRELVAADYVYSIKRLADPHCATRRSKAVTSTTTAKSPACARSTATGSRSSWNAPIHASPRRSPIRRSSARSHARWSSATATR